MPAASYDEKESLRLDIWLLHARFFKTRALCSKNIKKGRVRVHRNGQILRTRKPHYLITIGDHLTFTREEENFHIEILDVGTRRGPASEAQSLYKDV